MVVVVIVENFMIANRKIFFKGVVEMREVDLGKILLPDSIIQKVEEHKEAMLLAHSESDCYESLKQASFSLWFSDYLLKYGCKLLH